MINTDADKLTNALAAVADTFNLISVRGSGPSAEVFPQPFRTTVNGQDRLVYLLAFADA